MDLQFENPKHESLLNDYDALRKEYKKDQYDPSFDILKAIEVLRAADSLFDIPPAYRPHELGREYEYHGCFGIDVNDTHRVIFKPIHTGDKNFNINNYNTIKSVSIKEIYKDYHKK